MQVRRQIVGRGAGRSIRVGVTVAQPRQQSSHQTIPEIDTTRGRGLAGRQSQLATQFPGKPGRPRVRLTQQVMTGIAHTGWKGNASRAEDVCRQ